MSAVEIFDPIIREWFRSRFAAPTDSQEAGWPRIAAAEHTLIAAPTGSGKTLAAFLVCIDRLFRQWREGELPDGVQVVYVSPLKALSNDIERNLQTPLDEIRAASEAAGLDAPPIRTAVRTGDTPSSQRQAMLRRPPHILVTTPESLYLMLTSEKSRETLVSTRTVIVDEIHALARDKRGSHLALTLERLEQLTDRPLVRIGLSATQRPIEEIAEFLVGRGDGHPRECHIVDTGHVRQLDLAITTPASELAAVCSNEQWDEVYGTLSALINSHRSTLIFVNTRRLAERVTHHLTEMLGDDAVASHHGSLARPLRLAAEKKLKNGELKAIVATASLEMGIDIGFIDLVCQIGAPKSIATFLQRVGRSGHSLGAVPKGRLFPLTRDELWECMALVGAVRKEMLDSIEIPDLPLDILAQQIVAAVACDEWDEDDLFEVVKRAHPFRDIDKPVFDEVLELLSEGPARGVKRGAYLHWDRIGRRLRARRGARLTAITSGGAIPEKAEYRVVTESDKTFVGTVDEDFAIESMAGDVFLLGNTSWQIRTIRSGEVIVRDAGGAPPTIPFWFGEGPGRTVEFSDELSLLREELQERLAEDAAAGFAAAAPARPETLQWLSETYGISLSDAEQVVQYARAQIAALGLLPTKEKIVFERFFDESGGMQLVIHAPLGSRINRAWGLAMRKRFCRTFDFELQAAADDNGVLLSLSPQHSFPIEQLFKMLTAENGRHLLMQALLAAPMFQVRWRWNVTRALAVLRRQAGKKVPPHLQRFRADDLLAAAFPETVGCLENHHGDVEIPDHPYVRQTMHDCLHEAMDVDRWINLLESIENKQTELVPRDTREPSPFAHQLLNANPYAFLDGAPLEERRTRAVATRRSLSTDDFDDLTRLDEDAIRQVRQEAWPLVRDADELHDALHSMVVARDDELNEWRQWLVELQREGRAARIELDPPADDAAVDGERPETTVAWIASERWPLVSAVYKNRCRIEREPRLPESLQRSWDASAGWVEILRGRTQVSGPASESALAELVLLKPAHVHSSLEALEGQGVVLRGRFTDECRANETTEWCDRRLLARIHRMTLDGLRRRIQPVTPEQFMRFLVDHHHLRQDAQWRFAAGAREAIGQLQGFEAPAAAWENELLAARVENYEPQWLDQLFLGGEAVWGRLRPPQRDESRSNAAPMTRVMPMCLALREHLSWLLPPQREPTTTKLSGSAEDVLNALSEHGALFAQDLKAVTELLPGHLDEALRELTSYGRITSDGFAAIRALLVANHRTGRHRRRHETVSTMSAPAGRWSLFPGPTAPIEHDEYLRKWCRLLLRRYGVVFRDLLGRESTAPPWRELVPQFRRLELRGEIRGGRFISGVSGEQFAEEAAVERLREVRDRDPENEWIVLSAADPLNLFGVITPGGRLPALYKNRFLLINGELAATLQSGKLELFIDADPATTWEIHQALLQGRRREASIVGVPPG